MFDALKMEKTPLFVVQFYKNFIIFLRKFLIGMSKQVVTLRLRGL